VDAAVLDATAHPDDAGATGRLGMVLHAYQKLDLAELCYRRAHAMDPKAFEWPYYLTVVEQLRGEMPQTIDDARAAVKIDPSSRPGRMRLAEALLQAHELKESLEIYEKLVAEEPDLALYQYGLGKVLAAQGTTITDAVPHLRRACELSPNFSAAHYALAVAYQGIGDPAQSGREMEIYRKNPDAAPPEDPLMAQITALNRGGLIGIQAARQDLAQGRPADAAKELETAIANNPSDEAAHSILVSVYRQLKQPDKAEQQYRIAVQLTPSTSAHYAFGLLMLDQDRYADAGQAFRRALDVNPHDTGASTSLGRLLELQGDTQGAIRQCGIALESNPNSRAAHYVLGLALLKDGQTQDAIAHLLKTLEPVDGKTPGYMMAVADAYRKAGDESRAKNYEQLSGGSGNSALDAPAVLAEESDAGIGQGAAPGR